MLIKTCNPSKLEAETVGPFVVREAHSNGTLTIERQPNALERLNVRRLIPHNKD